jgi:hypothetical protein
LVPPKSTPIRIRDLLTAVFRRSRLIFKCALLPSPAEPEKVVANDPAR